MNQRGSIRRTMATTQHSSSQSQEQCTSPGGRKGSRVSSAATSVLPTGPQTHLPAPTMGFKSKSNKPHTRHNTRTVFQYTYLTTLIFVILSVYFTKDFWTLESLKPKMELDGAFKNKTTSPKWSCLCSAPCHQTEV